MSDDCLDLGIDDFLVEEIAQIKALIRAYDTAILAVSSSGQSYQLNTGQTTISVNKGNIGSQREARASLMNELTTLEARLTGRAAVRVVPAW